MTASDIGAWLEATSLGTFVTQTEWGFATLAAAHLLALGLSAGTMLWFDLRLLGVALTSTPIPVVYRRIAPWALSGYAVMFASGAALFVGYATAAAGNTAFRVKLLALTVAGLNAGVFHLVTARRAAVADWTGPRLVAARAAGAISVVAWAIAIAAGRIMSYTMF